MNKIVFFTVSTVLVMMASAAIIPLTPLDTTRDPLTPPPKTGDGIIAPDILFPTLSTSSEDTRPCYRFLSFSLECIQCFP